MKDLLIVYWSGTGNTETMANAVAKGAADAGASVTVKKAGEASAELVKSAGAVALGCPAMGAEVLEESEMEPFVAALGKAELEGKPLGLFGSYDWGDGQWMRDWEERMKGLGANLAGEGLTVNLTPDEEALGKCRDLGKSLAA
jgi:flavodoxin short chain